MWCSAVGCIVTLILSLLAAPLAAKAQPLAKVPRIGWLSSGSPLTAEQRQQSPFFQRLRELGWVEGKNKVHEIASYVETKRPHPGGARAKEVDYDATRSPLGADIRIGRSEGMRMTLYVGSTVLNVADLHRATAFWTAALGYVVRDASPDFVVLTDPRRRWSNISLQWSDAPKGGRNRLHLDLYTKNQLAEVARLGSLGATRLPWEYSPDADYIVMADPDGNEFCVINSPYSQEDAGSGHGK